MLYISDSGSHDFARKVLRAVCLTVGSRDFARALAEEFEKCFGQLFVTRSSVKVHPQFLSCVVSVQCRIRTLDQDTTLADEDGHYSPPARLPHRCRHAVPARGHSAPAWRRRHATSCRAVFELSPRTARTVPRRAGGAASAVVAMVRRVYDVGRGAVGQTTPPCHRT